MAFYDYKCTDETCDTIIEVEHGLFEEKTILCPNCQAQMQKMITGGGGVIYRGTDFYCKSHIKPGEWGD